VLTGECAFTEVILPDFPADATRDVHRGVAQVARATAHMPFSTQVALLRKKKIVQWM